MNTTRRCRELSNKHNNHSQLQLVKYSGPFSGREIHKTENRGMCVLATPAHTQKCTPLTRENDTRTRKRVADCRLTTCTVHGSVEEQTSQRGVPVYWKTILSLFCTQRNKQTDGQTDKQAGIGKHRRHLRISLQMKRKSFYFDFTHAFEAFTVRLERGTGKCFVCVYLAEKGS